MMPQAKDHNRIRNEILSDSLFYRDVPTARKVVLLFDDMADHNTECRDAYILFKYLCSVGVNAKYLVLEKNPLLFSLIKRGVINPNIIAVKNLDEFFLFHKNLIGQTWCILQSYHLPKHYASMIKSVPTIARVYIGHGELFSNGFNPAELSNYNFIICGCAETADTLSKYKIFSQDNIIKSSLPRYDGVAPDTSGGILVHFGPHRKARDIQKFTKSLRKFTDGYKNLRDLKIFFCPDGKMVAGKFGINLCKRRFRHLELIEPAQLSHAVAGASILVTDYSHVALDFAYADKPVIFYDFNSGFDRYVPYNPARSEQECFAMLLKYAGKEFVLEKKNAEKNNELFWGRCTENCRMIWDFMQGHIGDDESDSESIKIIKRQIQDLRDDLVTLAADKNGVIGLIAKLKCLGLPKEYYRFFYAIQPGDIIFDCGANQGKFVEACRHMNAEVYAFEPVPRIYSFLTNRFFNDPHVLPFNVAVGVHDEVRDFFIKDHDYFDDSGNMAGLFGNQSAGYQVKVIDLCDFIRREIIYKGKRIRILKLDVEGAELEIIKKLLRYEIYKHCDAILCEVHYPDEIKEELRHMAKSYGADNIYLDYQ
ncbi:MAG: FkbM family methyltransferase [Rickettsiales bacterium]|jgi:FkbM family methyltransferase|nr:FkbM family methyltransferase [Rickettsiales bacterium]